MSTSGTPRHGENDRHSEHHHHLSDHHIGEHHHAEDFYAEHRHRDKFEMIDRDTAQVIAGGSVFEVIAGAGAATLGILGLVGIMPVLFVTIGIIAVGVGLMLAGGSVGAKYEDVLNASDAHNSTAGVAAAGGGITAETVGGAAAAAMGILALLGVEAMSLIPIGLIVAGGAMAFGAGATRRLSDLVIGASGAPRYKQRVATESVKGAAFMQMLAGLGAAVLGVLMLVGIGSGFTFSLIAVIALGAGLLLSGLAAGGKFISMLYRDDSDDNAERRRPVYREYRSNSEAKPV